VTYQETPYNRSCIHHTLGFLDAERCPYCGAPNLRHIAKKRLGNALFVVVMTGLVVAFYFLLTRF
jgi:hypothetical protein